MLNLCAQLQIDLVRLTIISQTWTNGQEPAKEGDLVLPTAGLAQEAKQALDQAISRLYRVRLDDCWVYPALLRGIADALMAFPLSEVLEKAGEKEQADIARMSIQGKCASLRRLASRLEQKGLGVITSMLSRLLQKAATSGAVPTDDNLYQSLAWMLTDDRDTQLDIQYQCRVWAAGVRQSSLGPQELLTELIEKSPMLQTVQQIVLDWLDRSTSLIYVPFTFAETIGVVLPVCITADFYPSDPVLGDGVRIECLEENESDVPSTGVDFRRAVAQGRRRACVMLGRWNRRPQQDRFPVTVGLPKIWLNGGTPDSRATDYDQGSIEIPVALAVFRARMGGPLVLNAETVPTGPISPASLMPKYQAAQGVGGANRLLAVSGQRLQVQGHRPGFRYCLLLPHDDHRILSAYFDEEVWNRFLENNFIVLQFNTKQNWNDPLTSARSPLLEMQRHVDGINSAFGDGHVAQVHGLSGTGKTWATAQWIKKVMSDDSYDRILYTSVPNFNSQDTERERDQWAQAAFRELSRKLSDQGMPALEQRLTGATELPPDLLVQTIRDALCGQGRLLLVIDDAQFLLSESGEWAEDRFRHLINAVVGKDWTACHLLLVHNRRPDDPRLPEPYHTGEGFTLDEARDYLRRCNWGYPDRTDRVVDLLAGHPRALSILANHVTSNSSAYRLHPDLIDDLLNSLQEDQGVRLRGTVSEKVLQYVMDYLKQHDGLALEVLNAGSTFIRNFKRDDLSAVCRAAQLPVQSIHDAMTHLEQQSLTYYNRDRKEWWIHGLVRNHVQDQVKIAAPELYRQCHIAAGCKYFPLTKEGKIIVGPKLSDQVLRQYQDAVASASALYHFQAAEYVEGMNAVVNNHHDAILPRVEAWLKTPKYNGNFKYGYVAAERLLDKVMQTLSGRSQDETAGANAAPPEFNRLMGMAVYRQRQKTKWEKARLHFKQALEKGETRVKAEYVGLLCDLSASQDASDPENPDWLEAVRLFNEMRDYLDQTAETQYKKFDHLSEAYVKVSQRLHSWGDDETALNYLDEASGYGWSDVFLLGSEIARGRNDEIGEINWLERGLEAAPADGSLWQRYFILKALAGEAGAIPADWRRLPRGPKTGISLAQELVERGLPDAADVVLGDLLDNYANNELIYQSAGKLYLEWGRSEKSQQVYERGLLYCPYSSHITVALGKLYEINAPGKAESIYRKLLKTNPAEGHVYISLASLLKKFGHINEAVIVLKDATRLVPQDGSVYVALASLLEREGRRSEAVAVLEQGRKAKDTSVYEALIDLYEIEGQIEKTEALTHEARSLFPKHPSFALYTLDILLRHGAANKAVEELEKSFVDRRSDSADYVRTSLDIFRLECAGQKAEAADRYSEQLLLKVNSFATWRLAEI